MSVIVTLARLAYVTVCNFSDFGTALHAACFGGHLPLVDLLIRGGANVNIRGPANQSCLFLAALKGHIKIVKVLLQKHAVLDNQDQLGKYCFQFTNISVLFYYFFIYLFVVFYVVVVVVFPYLYHSVNFDCSGSF